VQIHLDVTPKQGTPRRVTAEAQDLVAFEREFNKSVASFQENVFLTDLFWLAWHAEKRAGQTTLEFDPWIATLSEIGVSEEPAEIVPLEISQPIG
jgi:hypothetical protein